MRGRQVFRASRANGSLIQLIDFLDLVDGAHLRWTLFEFYIIGPAPAGMELEAFEAATFGDSGVAMSWAELRAFAAPLSQTIDGTVVATTDAQPRPHRSDAFHEAVCVIEVIDSSKWVVTFDEAQIDANAVARVGE